MASSADVRDIMGMAPLDTTVTKDLILGTDKKRFAIPTSLACQKLFTYTS